MKKVVLFILAMILVPFARAQTLESIYFNLGNHTEFFNGVQNDTSGGTRKMQFAPTVGSGLSIPLSSELWRFLPEFNWVLPKFNEHSRIIKNIFMLRADFAYDPLEWLRLRAGTSIMFLNQHGRGGKANLNNGNSTSTFYYPDENHSSMNNTFDLGIEYLPRRDWSLRLQTYTYSLFSKDTRQVSYTLFVTYYWERTK